MERIPGVIIFLAIFLSLYGAMNFYVLARLAGMFEINRDYIFYILFILLTLSYLAASLLEFTFNNSISKFSYIIAATWMGLLFLLLSGLLVYEIVHLIVKVPPRTAGKIILLVVGVVAAFAVVNAWFTRVRTIEIEHKEIANELSVVQLSDLHIGSIHKEDFLQRIVSRTNQLNPDLVVITGDLFDGPHRYRKAEFEPLNNLKAPAVLVAGNHEIYAGMDKVERMLEDIQVTLLRNRSIDLKGLQIIGIDDANDRRQVEKELVNIKIDPSKFNVLLYHRPDGVEAAREAGIDLMLTGHLHGGQVFPFNLVIMLFYQPMRGFHHFDGIYLNISTGTGTWGPPMRLGSSSEITRIKLKPHKDH
jgi:predicted MPP superfamily phosphohydrolase